MKFFHYFTCLTLLLPHHDCLAHVRTSWSTTLVLWQVALLNVPARRICFVLHWMCLPVFKVETHSSQKSLSWSSSAKERERDKEGILQIAVRNPNVLRKPDPTPPAESIKEAEMWNLSPFLRTKISECLQLYARFILIKEILDPIDQYKSVLLKPASTVSSPVLFQITVHAHIISLDTR